LGRVVVTDRGDPPLCEATQAFRSMIHR